jgi:outer membrane lipoprotein SlyB
VELLVKCALVGVLIRQARQQRAIIFGTLSLLQSWLIYSVDSSRLGLIVCGQYLGGILRELHWRVGLDFAWW